MIIIVIGILSLILAFPAPPFRWLRDPGWVMAAVALATVLPPLIAAWGGRRALRKIDAQPHDPYDGQVAYGRTMFVVQTAIAVLHGAVLCLTDWMRLCGRTPVIGDWPMLPGVLSAIPLLLSIALVWIAVYPVDRAIRQLAVEAHLVRGKPAHPVWSLGRFLVFNFRHQVAFVLVPMFVILAARDVIDMYKTPIVRAVGHPFAPDLLLGLAAGLVAIAAPVVLRYVWLTVPLPSGPLRDQLERLSAMLRLRCREILVWKSGGMIINAAVMGVVAPLRYVMITDGMLEQMDDRKIEAVFGHEAGHVKRHHIFYFLLFALVSGCLVTVLGQRLEGHSRVTIQVATGLLGLVMLLKWGVVFGWVSRMFERQADLFGVHTLGLAGVPCDGECPIHHPTPGVRPVGRPMCAAAAHLFSDTLNEVARLNNIPPEAWSWRHGSIAQRSRVLQDYALHPARHEAFERSVGRLKAGIWVAAVGSTLWAAWELRIWRMIGIDF